MRNTERYSQIDRMEKTPHPSEGYKRGVDETTLCGVLRVFGKSAFFSSNFSCTYFPFPFVLFFFFFASKNHDLFP